MRNSISLSPGKIYGWLIGVFALIFVVILPLSQIGYVGENNNETSWDANFITLMIFIASLFITSIATTVFYREWAKKYWYVNAIIFVLSGFVCLFFIWICTIPTLD